METRAQLRNLRMSAKKVRLVAGLVRGKTAEEAARLLQFTTKRAAPPLLKLLKSALANARHNAHVSESAVNALRISRLLVDQGSVMKRFRPQAHGRAVTIRKPFSHITLVLSDAYPRGKKASLPEGTVAVKEVKRADAPAAPAQAPEKTK